MPNAQPTHQCFCLARLLRLFLAFADGAPATASALRFCPTASDVLTLTTVDVPRWFPAARIWASATGQSVDASSMAYLR
jgi:hypothetical protein